MSWYSSDKSDLAFDLLNLDEQIEQLKKAKSILEEISGVEVISFRAPALRVNKFTVEALKQTGFKIDSSVASQRADMFFSFGSMRKLKWLYAPRKCYYASENNLCKKGDSPIYEIPNISYIFPLTGTFMRIFPGLTSFVRNIANWESKMFNHHPVFIIHPNEFLEEELDENLFQKRSKI